MNSHLEELGMINETKPLIQEFNVTAKPITPIFVWSGDTLYKNADFKIVNNKVLIIDIMKLISKSIKLEEGFKEENAREIQGYKLIFDNHPDYDNLLDQGIFMINNNLIPGSSLKGLIRTSLANRLVKDDPNILSEVKINIKNFETKSHKKSRNDIKNLGKPIEDLFKRDVGYERYKKTYDMLTRLIVSDPEIQNFKLNLRKIEINEINGNFHKEILAITLDEGLLNYNIEIFKPINYGIYEDKIKNLDSKITKDMIIESIKNFSNLLVKKELEKIKSDNKYKNYQDFLTRIKNSNNSNNCFPLRIGMFTSHIAKTVEVNKELENFRSNLLSKIYRHYWDNKTLKVTKLDNDYLGIGWIMICVN
jgi:CRISPR type III-A-associated RAMP protein Csm5